MNAAEAFKVLRTEAEDDTAVVAATVIAEETFNLLARAVDALEKIAAKEWTKVGDVENMR